jgi:hypothetical protein
MSSGEQNDKSMFPTTSAAFDEALLDLHFGRLSAAERERLLEQVKSDAVLASQHEALTGVFAALGNWREAPAADLAERVLMRVKAAGPSLRVTRSAATRDGRPAPKVVWENERVIRLHSIRDVMAVAAMVVLAVGVGVPSLLHMRERGQRTMCAANLAQIGRGLQAYASTFGDDLPFAGWNTASSWRPTNDPRLDVVPNRKHLFPLVRAQYVPTTVFLCPSERGVAMSAEQARQRDDFLESRNVSYANQNMAGVRPTLKSNPAFVVLADDNPCFSDGQPLIEVAAQNLGLRDPVQANSRAHGGVGQNILRLSGATEWTTTPNSGIANDNIWTLSNISHYTGREGPATATDSHLLK